MSNLFEELKEGLEQAVEFEQTGRPLPLTKVCIKPVKKYDNKQIREIRMNAGMTQTVFAEIMGVSKKTVEAWENGRIHTTGPSNRLIGIIESGNMDYLYFIDKK